MYTFILIGMIFSLARLNGYLHKLISVFLNTWLQWCKFNEPCLAISLHLPDTSYYYQHKFIYIDSKLWLSLCLWFSESLFILASHIIFCLHICFKFHSSLIFFLNLLFRLNTCEDAQLGSQSPLTKGKAVRAPRTGAGVVINTPSFPRSSGAIDGSEQPSCLNKVQTLTGASNRKRSLPTGASSPPVARWGGQRREKISRTRRANVISPVSNFDEAQAEGLVAPDVGARLSSMESSKVLYNRAIPNNTHLKLKVENVPSLAAPSESEESIVHENKSKEKGTDNGEIDDGTLNAVHKAATFVLPTKKNTVPLREEIGYGVRRQGRSGSGSVHSKAFLQLNKEKLESLETAKPLKSRRLTSDKPERCTFDVQESKHLLIFEFILICILIFGAVGLGVLRQRRYQNAKVLPVPCKL